jgi:hypothetical protein
MGESYGVKKIFPLLVVTALLGLGAHAAMGASGSATPSELTKYLNKMAPLNAKVVQSENRLIKAELALLHGGPNTVTASQRAMVATLLSTATRMSQVVPPSVLKGPHAAFISSLKLEARAANAQANALRLQTAPGSHFPAQASRALGAYLGEEDSRPVRLVPMPLVRQPRNTSRPHQTHRRRWRTIQPSQPPRLLRHMQRPTRQHHQTQPHF